MLKDDFKTPVSLMEAEVHFRSAIVGTFYVFDNWHFSLGKVLKKMAHLEVP